MKLDTIELDCTKRFSQLFLDYIQGKSQLKDFYNNFPNIENFKAQIEAKQFSTKNREALCQELNAQYNSEEQSEAVKKNLSLLTLPNTFTITTGHQLNIFTGPLYFIFKIVTVINTCKVLAKAYPEYNFVPLYWMASEDHDFDEINHFRLEEKKYQWVTDQTGAVGRFKTKGIESLIKEIPGLPEFFKTAYSNDTLAAAVRHYVNHLFGEQGLIIVDGDAKNLKSLFKNVISDDIFKNSAKGKVTNSSNELGDLGYDAQVFPRDINFFYLDNGVRSRIEESNGKFKVLDTKLEFTRAEIDALIENNPEKFSPNVILRPLYQEMILPNLAYVGGPGELAYWFQLKSMFDHYHVEFPILMPRNFGMVVPVTVLKKIEKVALSWEEIFEHKNVLHKKLVIEKAKEDVLLNGQIAKMTELFDRIKKQASEIDPTLVAHVDAQSTKTKNKLEIIEKKFIRAEKRKQSDFVRQVDNIIDYLCPNGGLQERTDNFLNFYISNQNFVEDLLDDFDPFDFRFHILTNGQ